MGGGPSRVDIPGMGHHNGLESFVFGNLEAGFLRFAGELIDVSCQLRRTRFVKPAGPDRRTDSVRANKGSREGYRQRQYQRECKESERVGCWLHGTLPIWPQNRYSDITPGGGECQTIIGFQPALVQDNGYLLYTVGASVMSYLPDSYKVRSGPGVSGDRRQRPESR